MRCKQIRVPFAVMRESARLAMYGTVSTTNLVVQYEEIAKGAIHFCSFFAKVITLNVTFAHAQLRSGRCLHCS